MGRSLLLVALAGSACHVFVPSEITRPAAGERIVHTEAATAQPASLIWAPAGRLRFVEPLTCPTEELIHQRTTRERATRPNLATFAVGVIATAVGGVLLTSGLFSKHPGSDPTTYVGIAGLAAGLPLAIGPWLGNRTELVGVSAGHDTASSAGHDTILRRPGPSQPCGERALHAGAASLAIGGGLEIHGAVDGDGMFEISPYQWIDAYGPRARVATAITATLDGATSPRATSPSGTSLPTISPREISTVLEPAALAQHAAEFLAAADFDARVEPLRLVPGVVAGTLRASLTSTARGPAIRIVLPLKNDGPGDAWALRGQLEAAAVPAIDGRMIYVGMLASGAAIARELMIPITASTAATLRNATIDVAVELHDAHGTAPATPVRFHGALLGDLPR